MGRVGALSVIETVWSFAGFNRHPLLMAPSFVVPAASQVCVGKFRVGGNSLTFLIISLLIKPLNFFNV
jgi:hypothetical protein